MQVRPASVAAAARLGFECTELLNQGVTFVTDGTQFIYAKPAEARMQKMREATRDARARAEQIASESGRTVRELRAARVGAPIRISRILPPSMPTERDRRPC
jgi:hypothetical protein